MFFSRLVLENRSAGELDEQLILNVCALVWPSFLCIILRTPPRCDRHPPLRMLPQPSGLHPGQDPLKYFPVERAPLCPPVAISLLPFSPWAYDGTAPSLRSLSHGELTVSTPHFLLVSVSTQPLINWASLLTPDLSTILV